MAKSVKGSKTEQSLKEAFAGESQANRRYLYFANQADIAGANDVARSGVVGKRHLVRMRGPLHRPRLLTQIVDSPNADTNHSA